MKQYRVLFILSCCAILLLAGCAAAPFKRYYMLNYVPTKLDKRIKDTPYPYTIRIKEFSIEEAYARPQIVYRKNQFELQYYFYRVWAVNPERMITDLIYKHLVVENLVSSVTRRYDEGTRPDFEIVGNVEAIEEFDSEEVWFAHLALRIQLRRFIDGKVIYTRHFDFRKKVGENQPEYVIKEMSQIMEYIMRLLIHDLDVYLAKEMGLPHQITDSTTSVDTTQDSPDLWQ